MIGKTILHLPRGIKESVLLVSTTKKLKADMQMNPNVLSNGVNKILEKLGEARLLMTCIGELSEVSNG